MSAPYWMWRRLCESSRGSRQVSFYGGHEISTNIHPKADLRRLLGVRLTKPLSVDLEDYDRILSGKLWDVFGMYGLDDSLLRAIR